MLGPDANRGLLVSLPGTGALTSTRLAAGNSQTITWSNASTNQDGAPLFIAAQFSGTSNIVTGSNFVSQATTDNLKQTGANGASAFAVTHSTLAGSSGGRVGISSFVNQVGAGTSRADGVPALYYTGFGGTVQASYNEGGTNARTDGFGGVFGGAVIARLNSGATNFLEIAGWEADCAVRTGASAGRVTGVKSVLLAGHAVHGALGDDGAYIVGRQAGVTTGWDYGLQLSTPYGPWSYEPGASLIKAGLPQDGSSTAAARGVDLRVPVFSSDAWASPGAAITGGGAFRTGTGFLSGTATTTTLDVSGSITTGNPTVAAGGSGWGNSGNDVAEDAYGGLYKVTGVAGVATTVVVVARPVVTGAPPANPVALTARAPSSGLAATVNLTWTAGTALSLQPSGGALRLPGIPASASYANDAAAATGGVPVGQLYRNGSVLQVRVA